jgi:hypothetical protein
VSREQRARRSWVMDAAWALFRRDKASGFGAALSGAGAMAKELKAASSGRLGAPPPLPFLAQLVRRHVLLIIPRGPIRVELLELFGEVIDGVKVVVKALAAQALRAQAQRRDILPERIGKRTGKVLVNVSTDLARGALYVDGEEPKHLVRTSRLRRLGGKNDELRLGLQVVGELARSRSEGRLGGRVL